MEHDRIEKQVLLKAPLERVWRAISDSRRFGAWFGMEVEGSFVAGTRVRAKIRPTQVDAAVAEMQKPYDGVAFDLWIERVEPMRCFAFRWHPGVPESDVPLPDEERTLVVFELEQKPDGVLLTIGVSTMPGPTAFTVTPYLPNSIARERVMATTAALVLA
jgi:uncharacterized protein YndB with AHSA1/START domain